LDRSFNEDASAESDRDVERCSTMDNDSVLDLEVGL
jgi:hypothetical protein